MSSQPFLGNDVLYAHIDYEDPYVQPLILAALEKVLPPYSFQLISSLEALSTPDAPFLQWVQYESINFDHLLSHHNKSLANAYIIRKALIRKHYLSTTIANWIIKYPDSLLKRHVKPSVEFEVDFAEFLDDALVEAWDLKESWERGAGKEAAEREWWILKPGMSERGQGIRLFSSEGELTAIFEEWDPEDEIEEDEDDEKDEEGGSGSARAEVRSETGDGEEKGIITSQLRHFIVQPYIHPPLLLRPSGVIPEGTASLRKFHIRTYVLAVGALQVYVYRPMLALFAAHPYAPPASTTSSTDHLESLKAHLTNTCLQDTNQREGSVTPFWSLPGDLPAQPPLTPQFATTSSIWKDQIFNQICAVTGEVFEAAARGMSIHFQPLPNAFEVFGVDYMVGIEEDGRLNTWLLEVNAFPDFRQTGDDLKDIVGGLFEGVVQKAVQPKLGLNGLPSSGHGRNESTDMVKVLDIDLGRR